MYLSPVLKEVSLSADQDHYRRPQVMKMQKTSDRGPQPLWIHLQHNFCTQDSGPFTEERAEKS